MMTPLRLSILLPFVVAALLWLAGFVAVDGACTAVSVRRLATVAASGLSVWLFIRFLQVLTPGTRVGSRFTYTAMLFALSPVFIKTGAICGLQSTYLLAVLLFLFAAVKTLDRPRLLVWWGLGVLSAGVFVCCGLDAGIGQVLRSWSLHNLFRSGFGEASQVLGFSLPNGCCVLIFPLMHPGFCLLLPGLFLLSKKTDLHLPSKKLLFWSLIAYLIAVGGLPQPLLSALLPAYGLWLLLLFPSWDRFFCYGFYFFPRLAWVLLILLGVLQFVFLVNFPSF